MLEIKSQHLTWGGPISSVNFAVSRSVTSWPCICKETIQLQDFILFDNVVHWYNIDWMIMSLIHITELFPVV